MSQENVDRIRRFHTGTYTHANWLATRESFLANLHPELVYHPRTDEPDPSPRVGRDAYEGLIYGFVEALTEITFDILELIDGGDLVIASTVLHGRGSASGVEVNEPYVFVYRMRDGLIVEGWEYKTKQEAVEAAGLSA